MTDTIINGKASEARSPNSEAPPGEAPKLRIVVVGHVDHGKSTLIGRIFYDTDSLPDGKVEAIKKASTLEGMEFEYAFLLDALLEEQAQNITIDTTQIPFRTDKRGYVLIDAPGHREFLKNMVTGAASADAAILLVAANEGVREQSRRHGYLLRLLGLRQIVVAVNKMDLVGYDETTFNGVKAEYSEFLRQIGLTAQQFIPISAREGDNIAARATEKMPWYDGPSILEMLDRFEAPAPTLNQPLRFPIQDIFRFDARRILAGRVETGTLRVGDTLRFSPGGRESRVASIERWNGPPRDYAIAGESVGVLLEEQLFVERGQVASRAGEAPPIASSRLKVNLFWMGPEIVKVGEKLRLRLATQEVGCRIVQIERRIDASTLADADGDKTEIARHDVAEAIIETDTIIAFDTHDHSPDSGAFRSGAESAGCGRRHFDRRGGGRRPEREKHCPHQHAGNDRRADAAQQSPGRRRLADRPFRFGQVHHCWSGQPRPVRRRSPGHFPGWRQSAARIEL